MVYASFKLAWFFLFVKSNFVTKFVLGLLILEIQILIYLLHGI